MIAQASVVIPVYGPNELLIACLAALDLNTPDHQLILVDNATDYDFPEHATVVRNTTNLGFAKACNQGAAVATGDVIVFLNVDTEVRAEWLERLLEAFDSPSVGMAGSKLIYPDGSIQHSGVRFIRLPGQIRARNIHKDAPSRAVEAVTGACMAVRRDVFNECEGFDEGYWNGYEDVDLCLKVTHHGYSIRYVAESVVIHRESATGPDRWTGVSQNVSRLNEKWGSHDLRANKSPLLTG